jgi:hypothetical protein
VEVYLYGKGRIKISLLDYDKALFDKIKGIYDEVIFASPDEAFKINASQHDGRVLMPFISVWRLPEFAINRMTYNDSRVRAGDRLRFVDNTQKNLRGVPVTLTYQVDIYSNKRNSCDGITSELVLHLLENPYVNVCFGGGEEPFVQQFELVVSDNINDNTNISDFEDTGRSYRLTVEAVFNEAIIYRVDKDYAPLVEKVLVDIRDLDTTNLVQHFEVIED